VFDHFCPWVGNSIGKGNRHIFIAFVCIMSIAIGIGYCVDFGRLLQIGLFSWGPRSGVAIKKTWPVLWIMLWPIASMPLLLTLLGLAGTQLAQVQAPPVQMSLPAHESMAIHVTANTV
jgi:palmitoyltransferase ZDHHC13/17